MKTIQIVVLLVLVLFSASTSLSDEVALLLEDFDDGVKLSNRWTAIGKIRVARTDADSNANGMFAECKANANSKFLVNQKFQRPPYEKYDTIRFRIRAITAKENNHLDCEFQVFSQERRAALWRKFVIEGDEWQTVELPMQFFRYSNGASLSWNEVSRFGIHFRRAANVRLDDFELVAKETNANPYFSPAELGAFAFGPDLQHSASDHFAILTNDERVNRSLSLTELEKLYALVYADFPALAKPPRKVPVLIFSTKQEYEQFWPKFGQLFAASVAPMRGSGFSLLGAAGTYHSDKYGPVRPVLVHEACHALLGPALGLSNGSEWLHEGLANYYQLNWTKQDLQGIDDGVYRPLSELLNGKRVELHEYAQVTRFMKWLLEDEGRKKQLFAAMQEMRKRNSTALEPICEDFFEKSIDQLELEWLRWVGSR